MAVGRKTLRPEDRKKVSELIDGAGLPGVEPKKPQGGMGGSGAGSGNGIGSVSAGRNGFVFLWLGLDFRLRAGGPSCLRRG